MRPFETERSPLLRKMSRIKWASEVKASSDGVISPSLRSSEGDIYQVWSKYSKVLIDQIFCKKYG